MSAIIPPHSIVKSKKLGHTFRIGYYSKQDGTNCVWLVSASGEYEQTWDQDSLEDYFEVVSRSDEIDLYGDDRPELEPLT